MARSTIDSPFRPVEAQETNLSFSPIGPGMNRPLRIAHCRLRPQRLGGIDATSDLFTFVAAIPAELNWIHHGLRVGVVWQAFLPQR